MVVVLCMYNASVRAASTNYTMEQQLEECWVSLMGSPVPFAVFPLAELPLAFPLVKPPLVFPLAEPPLAFPLVELPPVLVLVTSMPKRSHWGLNTIRAKIQETSDYCTLHTVEIIVSGQSYFSSLPKHSPGGEGDGGSIFWKTREIGLPSYNDLSTLHPVHRLPVKKYHR